MRVLFAGLGGIGQRHLRLLSEIVGERLEVHAFRTRRQQFVLSQTLEIANESGLDKLYSITLHDSLESGLAANPRVLFITNPTSLHFQTAVSAIEAGVPVFIEKPITETVTQARTLVDRASSLGVRGMVGYQLRFHPLIQELLSLIKEGRVGRVVSAKFQVGEYLPNWHKYEDYRQMYAARKDLGGGVIRTQIHEIDLIHALFGVPDQVFSVGGKLSNLEIDVEDTVLTLFRFSVDGKVLPVSLSQDYLQRPAKRFIEIVGLEGKIEIDLIQNALRLYSGEGDLVVEKIVEDFQRDALFRAQLRSLIDFLDTGSPPPVSLESGAMSLAIADACLRSIQTGSPVSV